MNYLKRIPKNCRVFAHRNYALSSVGGKTWVEINERNEYLMPNSRQADNMSKFRSLGFQKHNRRQTIPISTTLPQHSNAFVPIIIRAKQLLAYSTSSSSTSSKQINSRSFAPYVLEIWRAPAWKLHKNPNRMNSLLAYLSVFALINRVESVKLFLTLWIHGLSWMDE